MKKITLPILGLCISFGFVMGSCKKEAKPPTPPAYESVSSLELLWRNAKDDGLYHYSNVLGLNSQGNMLHYKNVTSVEYYELTNPHTGESLWTWGNYVDDRREQFWVDPTNLVFKNDVFIMNTGSAIYAVNAVSGQTMWVQKLDSMLVQNVQVNENNDLFIAYKHRTKNDQKTTILKTNYAILNWQTVLTVDDSSTLPDFDCSFSFDKNKKGEKMMLFAHHIPFRSSMIYGYNLTTNQIDWTSYFEDRNIDYQRRQMSCYNHQLFITLEDERNGFFLESIDINTGRVIWENTYPTWKRNGTIFYFFNNTIVYLGDIIFCMDITNGNRLWQTNYSFNTFQQPLFYASQYKNFLLISKDSRLQILDVSKNELVYNQIVALPAHEFYSNTFVYPEKKLLYFFDNKKLNCFKIPAILN